MSVPQSSWPLGSKREALFDSLEASLVLEAVLGHCCRAPDYARDVVRLLEFFQPASRCQKDGSTFVHAQSALIRDHGPRETSISVSGHNSESQHRRRSLHDPCPTSVCFATPRVSGEFGRNRFAGSVSLPAAFSAACASAGDEFRIRATMKASASVPSGRLKTSRYAGIQRCATQSRTTHACMSLRRRPTRLQCRRRCHRSGSRREEPLNL